jgi:hypothetical protein
VAWPGFDVGRSAAWAGPLGRRAAAARAERRVALSRRDRPVGSERRRGLEQHADCVVMKLKHPYSAAGTSVRSMKTALSPLMTRISVRACATSRRARGGEIQSLRARAQRLCPAPWHRQRAVILPEKVAGNTLTHAAEPPSSLFYAHGHGS